MTGMTVEEMMQRMVAVGQQCMNSTAASNAMQNRNHASTGPMMKATPRQAMELEAADSMKATPRQAMELEAAAEEEARKQAELARRYAAAAAAAAKHQSEQQHKAADQHKATVQQQPEQRADKKPTATDWKLTNGNGNLPSKVAKTNAAASPTKSSHQPSVVPPEARPIRAHAQSDGPSLRGTPEQLEEAKRMSMTGKGGKKRERVLSKEGKPARDASPTLGSSSYATETNRGRPIRTPVSRMRAYPPHATVEDEDEPSPNTSTWNAFAKAPSTNAATAVHIPRNETPSVTSPESDGADVISPIKERKDSFVPAEQVPQPTMTDITNKLRAMKETNPALSASKTADHKPQAPEAKVEKPKGSILPTDAMSIPNGAENSRGPAAKVAKHPQVPVSKPVENQNKQPPSVQTSNSTAATEHGARDSGVPTEYVKHLTERVVDLEYEVNRLAAEAERRKFLGTESANAPYNIKVKLCSECFVVSEGLKPFSAYTDIMAAKPDIVTAQVNAGLTVRELCLRVFRQERLDRARVSCPLVKLESKPLGHLMTLGEAGVGQGKRVEISFQLA